MAVASALPPGFAHSFAIFVRTSNPSVVLLLPSATAQFLAGKLNLSDFFRFSFNVSSVSHTDSYSLPLLACSAAGLRACACAADQATYTISNMEAREVETTQISGNVWPQLVLFALGTFFVVSITQVPHSTSLARGSMASVTTKRKKGSQLVPIERCCKIVIPI